MYLCAKYFVHKHFVFLDIVKKVCEYYSGRLSMMYGLTMSVDGSLEMFNITDTMIDVIIEDINYSKDIAIVRKTDRNITIHSGNTDTIYFYDKDDRKEVAKAFIDVH